MIPTDLQSVLDTSLDAAVVMRMDGSVSAWNAIAEATFGWTSDEAIGRLLGDLIVPAHLREAHNQGLERYRSTGDGPVLNRRFEIVALHRKGVVFPVELAITPARDGEDQVFLGFLRDISERKRAEAALRESEQRFRATYNHAFVGIAEADVVGRFLRVNAQMPLITGYTEAELKERTFFAVTHPEDAGEDRRLYEAQWGGEIDTYSLEKRYIRKDGNVTWIEVMASMVRDDRGGPLYGIRIIRDISERKKAEEYQQLLVGELNHRVKNTLAVVQGIAHGSFQDVASRNDREAFAGRLAALATAHDLLVKVQWQSVTLAEIIVTTLSPFRKLGGDPFEVEGPMLLMPPKHAVTLSMALYELATNATKYGSLSCEGGRVSIVWSLETDGTDRRLHLRWVERGGPPVIDPTRRGFGTRLLQHGLAGELDGRVSLDFYPDGLVCVIDAKVPT